MPNPTTRVLALLELLQTHARISGPELARHLDVDVRTVRRYVASLEELGIPVTTERGRHGGYMLVAGFRLPPMMFTNDETLAVSLGLLAARGLGLADTAPAVASALAKLERVMPANLKRRLRAISETATLDVSHAIAAGSGNLLLALTVAAQELRRVRLTYRAADGRVTSRGFDPYGLVFRSGRWYVSGHCHLRGGLRSFRLDRVQQVETLDVGFVRPADFDAAGHLTFSIATLPRAIAVEVLLHTDLASATAELGDNIGLLLPRDDGVLLRTRTDSVEWFARQLARLSFGFRVIAPPALRDALRARAGRLLAHAGGT